MGSETPQDPSLSTTATTTWQESVSDLLASWLSVEASSDGKAAVKIEKACSDILERDGASSSSSSSSHALPEAVRSTIVTIYLRALIKGGRYQKVVDYCKEEHPSNSNNHHVEELAYSLYRLRNYEACRKVCTSNGSDGGISVNKRGLMHVYAQTLYRLGETNEADKVYSQLLNAEDPASMDADEREDALANALANCTANYTPGSLLNSTEGGIDKLSWLEEDDTLMQLLTSYGTKSSSDEEDGDELLQNYDLAYNLATYLLVSSDARSQSHLFKAKNLLEHAEASALTILEPSSKPPEEDNDEEDRAAAVMKEVARRKKIQQQQALAEKEAGPIRANLSLSKLLLGGSDNETEALRGYLTLVTKSTKSKGAAGGVEANLMATASNNLALLRDGKESVFDVIKRIPTTSSLSVSDDSVAGMSGKGSKEKGGGASSSAASMVPLVGATPQQVRIALFNRALLFAKMGNATGCLEALNVLRVSLKVSYHGDEGKKGEGGAGPASPKRSKGKKKKGAASTSGGGSGANHNVEDVPTAKPASEAETIAWNARADWLESELYRISESKDKSSEDILNDAIAKLDKASKNKDAANGALTFTKSQLLLHKAAVSNPQSKAQPFIEALESLPSSLKSCPGVTVTLASLHGSSNSNNKISESAETLLSSLGDDTCAKLAIAEFKMERGQYGDAVELLQGIVDEGDGDDGPSSIMEATALLVKALSYTDPSKAEEYVELLQEAMGGGAGSELDGEELESMEIPRFAKKALGGTSSSAGEGASGGSSSKVRKLIAATGGKGRSNMGERKKMNRESILRKRAKQREAYLSRLESEGRYDPNKTTLSKPDPERWIPKSQRSYNRRGRGRGRYKSNVGAQGGGAGAGMEKEAAKLDVAARVAAAAEGGGDGSSGQPSTANIKVSSSGATRKGKGGKRR